jgi:hypothetical protein
MKKLSLVLVMIAYCGLNVTIAQWNTSGNDIYNTNSGNVGIGNNVPGSLLYVGKITTEPTITVRNFGGTGGATYTMIDDASGANWKFKATLNGGFKIRDHANLIDVLTIEPNSAANSIYIKGGGSVGIGTATPGATDKLTVIQSTGRAIYAVISGSEATAIHGSSSATTGINYAIRGYHYSTSGAAGYFHADNNDNECPGAYGRTDGSVSPTSCGVVGQAYYGGIGVGAWSYTGDLFIGYDGTYPYGTLRFYVTNNGTVYADGGYNTYKKVLLPGERKEYRAFNSIQATESWIEDIGTSDLLNGEAIVRIDPIFAQTVNLQDNYKVFVTPVSEEMVYLVVTKKSPGEFVVKGLTLDGRPASCSFDYRIVAKDSEKPHVRMEVVDIPEPVNMPRED